MGWDGCEVYVWVVRGWEVVPVIVCVCVCALYNNAGGVYICSRAIQYMLFGCGGDQLLPSDTHTVQTFHQ